MNSLQYFRGLENDNKVRKDMLNIPIGAKHGLRAVTDLEFIEVQMGSDLVEEDIVRIYMTWEEVEEHCTWAE